MSTLERAIEIAAKAHAGQTDKAGAPYILHPLRVMMSLEDPDARIAAVLHDVVEDSEWTLDGLRAEGFTEKIVSAVDAVTKRKGETRVTAAQRTASDPLGCRVKLADVGDNMNLSRIPNPTDADHARLEEYREVQRILIAALDA